MTWPPVTHLTSYVTSSLYLLSHFSLLACRCLLFNRLFFLFFIISFFLIVFIIIILLLFIRFFFFFLLSIYPVFRWKDRTQLLSCLRPIHLGQVSVYFSVSFPPTFYSSFLSSSPFFTSPPHLSVLSLPFFPISYLRHSLCVSLLVFELSNFS